MARPRSTVNGNKLEKWLLVTKDYTALRNWSQQSARDERNKRKGPPHITVGGDVYYSIRQVEQYLRDKKGFIFEPYDPEVETKTQYIDRMQSMIRESK